MENKKKNKKEIEIAIIEDFLAADVYQNRVSSFKNLNLDIFGH